MILDHITSIDFTPSTNLKGKAIGANWVFLLPRLDLPRVLCIGAPPADMLPALKLISDELICTRPIPDPEVVVQPTDQIPAESVDLIYLYEKRGVNTCELHRILKPDGLIFYEYHGRDSIRLNAVDMTITRLFLTPTLGPVQTAVPTGQLSSRDFLIRRQLLTSTIRHQTVEQALKRLTGKSKSENEVREENTGAAAKKSNSMKSLLSPVLRRSRDSLIRSAHRMEQSMIQNPITSRWSQRNGVIFQNGKKPVGELPNYLHAGAQQCGVNIQNCEWAYVARGDYPSQKLLFYLFEPGGDTPSVVIKMVRDAEYNERLEREYHGLKHLRSSGFEHQDTIPQVFFQSYHRGLFFLGESVLDGIPFVQKSMLNGQCQYAHFVTQWMIDLGTQTRISTTGKELAELLAPLYQRFNEVYEPDSSQQQFLRLQLDRLQHAGQIPLVLRHGDPGLQNLLVTPDGGVAFLDWENAEVHGMPLWDLFYFLSAYCMKAGQVKSHLSNLEAYGRFFHSSSSMTSFLFESVDRYCARLDIHHNLIVPLYYLFWMYRSLKQSTMIKPGQVQNAPAWQILRRSISQNGTFMFMAFS